jgi:stress response protein YsnF
MNTITALYDTRGAAETAQAGLIDIGIDESDISIRGTDDHVTSDYASTEGKGFWASLGDLFMPDEDRSVYTEGVRRGGYLLTAQVPEGLHAQAEAVLESADPVDLDERSAAWRQEGWTGSTGTASGAAYGTSETSASGYAGSAGTGSGMLDTGGVSGSAAGTYRDDALATGTTGYAGSAGVTDTAGTSGSETYREDDALTAGATGTTGYRSDLDAGMTGTTRTGVGDNETLQVVDEELRVGKRQASGGNVRVRTYVRERPVEAQVDLQSERVTIERRPVDREVTPGVAAFQERTIEAVERAEEAVVDKVARVKEEIALHKDVETRTETVRDTVRETEVEIEDERGRTIDERR